MAYDDDLANRVRASLGDTEAVTELRMFGGWGVTVLGNMAVGVMNKDPIVRVGPDDFEDALARPGARPFDFTGRSMTGWIYVDGDALVKSAPLDRWVRSGVDFAQRLPPKATATRKRRSRP
jgi:TfoX/Sxy family transcriptional regulator of competence genes